ncbi:MAG: hypothetical protein K2G17_03225 [Duncaniella sp.]|nr:hypothetical protein [Duncaniella sp.]MDE6187126.1 hypothetical protein [Duncaniella sp.]
MSSALISTAIILAIFFVMQIGAIVLTFRSNRFAVIAAYTTMVGIALFLRLEATNSLIFWGIATAIVICLEYMLPKKITSSRRGVGYIAGAALAGTFVGLTISHEWMIVGAVAGAILGGIAYSRTPAGSIMEFPSSKFLNYLCAKGLPAVVTMCMAGTSVLWFAAILNQ